MEDAPLQEFKYWVRHANNWSILNASGFDGVNEVFFSREHYDSVEEAPEDAIAEMFEVMSKRGEELAGEYSAVIMFAQVGVQAGGSVSHLHGQVAACELPGVPCPVGEGCGVCEDVGAAREEGLLLFEDGEVAAYLTPTPSCSLEIRVSGPHGAEVVDLGRATWRVLAAARDCGYTWPYNILLHPGEHPHVHILVRTDAGVVYRRGLGATFAPYDLDSLAGQLRIGLT